MLQQSFQQQRLVPGIVIRAMHLRGILVRQLQHLREVFLGCFRPRNSESSHRQALRVDALVAKRILHPKVLEVEREVGPVEDGVVTDEDRSLARAFVLLLDPGAERLQRFFRRKHHCWQKKRILKKLDIRKAILLLLPEK